MRGRAHARQGHPHAHARTAPALTHIALAVLVRALLQQQGGDLGVAFFGGKDQRGVPVLQYIDS